MPKAHLLWHASQEKISSWRKELGHQRTQRSIQMHLASQTFLVQMQTKTDSIGIAWKSRLFLSDHVHLVGNIAHELCVV